MARSASTPVTLDDSQEWRLRYVVGDLVHYTEWTREFPTVETLYEQYRRDEYSHDVVIERRTEVRR